MKNLNSLLSLPIAYLLGSIPSAIWIAKLAKGKDFDIRDYGSKNAGLTNTFRVLGWKPALPVVFMDLLKGFFGPFIAQKMCHSFTCFAGFRGGKGVLAALGVFLAISPLTVLCAFALWIILTVTTKYVSVGSIFGCGLLGALSIFGYVCPEYYFESINLGQMILAVIVAVFVIVKHKSNIKRLLNGTENGFGSKRKK